MGRWSSAAYLAYIRTPRETLSDLFKVVDWSTTLVAQSFLYCIVIFMY